MSLVQRSPLTNYRGQAKKGIVRYVPRKGAPVRYDPEGRPIGTPDASPDLRRSFKEVLGSDRQGFTKGKGIRRGSVYTVNNTGYSGSRWGGTRSRA